MPYTISLGWGSEELDAVVPIAVSHGWESQRYEAGKALREEIGSLKNLIKTNI